MGRLGQILGPSWATSGPFWGHLRAQMGHLWPSWGHLGVILGDLVAIFGPFGLILGHLAVVLGRLGLSWAVLRPSWGRFGGNPEPCWSAAWSFTSRLLGMECGRCYPAGVSIRPHDEVDAGPVLNPTQELPKKVSPGLAPRRGFRRGFVRPSSKNRQNLWFSLGVSTCSLLSPSFSSSSTYLSHLRA